MIAQLNNYEDIRLFSLSEERAQELGVGFSSPTAYEFIDGYKTGKRLGFAVTADGTFAAVGTGYAGG